MMRMIEMLQDLWLVVKTSPSPLILPELRDEVPESDIFLLFGFFLVS